MVAHKLEQSENLDLSEILMNQGFILSEANKILL
jgi:hypothetical protein